MSTHIKNSISKHGTGEAQQIPGLHMPKPDAIGLDFYLSKPLHLTLHFYLKFTCNAGVSRRNNFKNPYSQHTVHTVKLRCHSLLNLAMFL